MCLTLLVLFVGCGEVKKNTKIPDVPKKKEKVTESFVKEIDTNEGSKIINQLRGKDDFILFDIRTKAEFDEGHLEGAINKDFYQSEQFSNFLDTLDKNKTYLVYCRTDNRSRSAKKEMERKGFKKIYIMLGGYTKWSIEKRPIVRRRIDKTLTSFEILDRKPFYDEFGIVNFCIEIRDTKTNKPLEKETATIKFYNKDHHLLGEEFVLESNYKGQIIFNENLNLSKGTYYYTVESKINKEEIFRFELFRVESNCCLKVPTFDENAKQYRHLQDGTEESKAFLNNNFLKNVIGERVLEKDLTKVGLFNKRDLDKNSIVVLFSPLCPPCVKLWNDFKDYDFSKVNLIPVITSIGKTNPKESIERAINSMDDEELKEKAVYDGESLIWENLGFKTTPKVLLLNDRGQLINVFGNVPVEKAIEIIQDTYKIEIEQKASAQNKVQVTFDLLDGVYLGNNKIAVKINKGTKIKTDDIPTNVIKGGHILKHFVDSNGIKFNFDDVVNEDITLTAVYEKITSGVIQKLTFREREEKNHFYDLTFKPDARAYLETAYGTKFENSIMQNWEGYFIGIKGVTDDKKKMTVVTYISKDDAESVQKIKDIDFDSTDYNHIVIIADMISADEFKTFLEGIGVGEEVKKNSIFATGGSGVSENRKFKNILNYESPLSVLLDAQYQLTDIATVALSFDKTKVLNQYNKIQNTLSVKGKATGEKTLDERIANGEFKFFANDKYQEFKSQNLYATDLSNEVLIDVHGNRKKLSELTNNGKATLLVISKKGCPGCIQSAQVYDEAYKPYKDKFNLIEVVFDIKSATELDAELNTQGIKSKEHFYCNNYKFNNYAIKSYPTYIILDKQNRIATSAGAHLANISEIVDLIGDSISVKM